VRLALAFSFVFLISCGHNTTSQSDRAPDSPAAPAVAASPATAASDPQSVAVSAEGAPFALSLRDGVLSFCDKRGGRRVDLKTGKDTASDQPCAAPTEANTACSGLSMDVVVRSPSSEPNDTVEVGGNLVPLDGRVHDCVADGKSLGIATASKVVVVDAASGAKSVVSEAGADRVAVGSGWVAWSQDDKVRAVKRSK